MKEVTEAFWIRIRAEAMVPPSALVALDPTPGLWMMTGHPPPSFVYCAAMQHQNF